MRTNLPIAVAKLSGDLSCLSDDRGHDIKFVISCAVDRWKAVFLACLLGLAVDYSGLLSHDRLKSNWLYKLTACSKCSELNCSLHTL